MPEMQRISAFEAFVPSKSKILKPEVTTTAVKSDVDVNTKSKVAGLFARLKNNKNALAIVQSNLEESSDGISTVDIKSDRATSKVLEKNLQIVSKFTIGIGPTNPKLISKLDIEANFDLKPLLVCNDITYPNGTSGVLRSCCLPDSCSTAVVQQKLRGWMDSQRTWLYPDRPVTSASMKINGVVADLVPCDFWQEPSLQDVSYVNIIKRRRLKWQGALCSAVDELLLEPKTVGCRDYCVLPEADLGGQRMKSFYILGSDSEISDSTISDKDTDGFANQQAAKCLPMSAVFFRNQRNEKTDSEIVGNSCDNDFRKSRRYEVNFTTEEDVSCILTGAKKSFIDRVIKLGAVPMEMIDKQELIKITAAENRNKKSNRNISSAGRLQETSSGRTLFFTGSYALRVVADCIAEIVFSTIKASKFFFDVPKIVSNWPFANGLRTPMFASFVQCRHKFSELSQNNYDEFINSTQKGSGNARSKVSRPLHRVFLTGIFYPAVLSRLAEVLHALSEVTPTENREGGGAGGGDLGDEGDILGSRGGGAGYVKSSKKVLCSDNENNSSTALHSHILDDSSSSSNIDTTRRKPFDIAALLDFDNAFMHPKSRTSTVAEGDTDDKHSEDPGPVTSVIPAEASRLPKIPMKFNSTIVDNLSSSIPYAVRSVPRFPGESSSSSSSVGMRGSMGGTNVLSSAYGAEDDYRNGVDSNPNGDFSWVAAKRAQDRPYFIVRTISAPRTESFCHYLKSPLLIPKSRVQDPSGSSASGDTDNDSVSMLPDRRDGEGAGGGEGAVATMDSHLPISEIRWPAAASAPSSSSFAPSSFSSSASSKTASSEGRKADKMSRSNTGSAADSRHGVDVGGGAEVLSGKKRKHPVSFRSDNADTGVRASAPPPSFSSSLTSESELDSCYEVVYGAKLPVVCLVQAKHSKTIMREKMETENSGALLNEMNKYEIYAPETLEDRQRKRKTM